MIRLSKAGVAAAMILTLAGAAQAQQDPGARAGNAYVPSTHTAGCGGVLCDGNDPQRAPGAAPPPPCQGLLCGLSPYSMQRPITASEAQHMQEEQARAAAAAAPAEPPNKGPHKHKTKKAAKAKAATQKSAAVRTPDPGTPASEAK